MPQTSLKRRRGAGAVEYGLVIALVAAGALVAVSQTGGSIAGLLSGAAGQLNTINSSVQPAETGEQPLYEFSSHTFTNCGRTGPSGPTLNQCRSAYSVASWAQDSAFFDQGTHQGFQLWTVPKTGTYRITAEGAEGGRGDHQAAGQGARIRGDFELAQGDQLTIVVGQAGQDSSSENGGGGGGTFVWEGARSGNPLIVAGGGGGGGYDDSNGWDAATGTSGTNSSCGYGQAHGGQGGRGGGYGGAGWSGDGSGGYGGRSTTFVGGPHDAWGGFGGGGGGASSDNGGGGGGGYSGGASGCDDGSGEGGGGGGSFNAGANAAASMNVGTNHGHVEIEFLEAD